MSQVKLSVFGEAGCGKDVMAEHLIEKEYFRRYAFADDVRNVSKKYFPDAYGDVTNKNRKLLQDVGTKFREIDPHVWIKSMLRNMKEDERISPYDSDVVVTDLRMPNEYEALKERGFIFIRVVVDKEVRLQRLRDRGDVFNEEDLTHHTESFYDEFKPDYTISNNGSLEELYSAIDELLVHIRG